LSPPGGAASSDEVKSLQAQLKQQIEQQAVFKAQFMKYLEKIKEKVTEMELKVLETQNEKNFYKQKYQEQEEVVNAYRGKETDLAVKMG
jgi:hypothetical protein